VHFDIPKFDGKDVLSWLFSMDQYFDFCRTSEEEKIQIAAFHMTGMAIPWFQMTQRAAPFRSWFQLKRALEIEFGSSLFGSPREILFKLTQQGSVTDYYTEFVVLANRTNIEPPVALKGCFVSGLRKEIRREVKAQCPTSLMRAVSLARLYEDKFTFRLKITPGPNAHRYTNHQNNLPVAMRPQQRSNLPPLLPTPTQTPLPNNNRPPIKRLTMAEQQIRREKGICFWCDDKFTPQHRCPNKNFMLYQLELTNDDDPQQNAILMAENNPSPDIATLEEQVLHHHLSYNALHGSQGPATIRVKVTINGKVFQALIDGGSYDSFLQPRVAKFLNLTIQPAFAFRVMVSNFETMEVEGFIPSLNVSIQGHHMHIPNVYLLHVAGGDLILGTS